MPNKILTPKEFHDRLCEIWEKHFQFYANPLYGITDWDGFGFWNWKLAVDLPTSPQPSYKGDS